MNNSSPAQIASARLGRMISWLPALLWRSLLTLIAALYQRPVPIILQMSEVECGAACLAMILNYYGRETRLAECRAACGIGRDGVTAQTIVRAAQHYGLRVKAFSLEPDQFKYVSLPAIVHWDFNHFVVVEHWLRKQVDIVDPAEGRRHLTAAEFNASFTGVVLTLEPGIHFECRAASADSAWRKYLTSLMHLPRMGRWLAQILGASLLLQIVGLALPVFTQVLVDQVLRLRLSQLMTMLGIGMLILALIQAVTSYLRAVLLMYLQARLDSQLMIGFFQHVLKLPWRFFQQRASGDLLMRLGSSMVIREMLTSQVLSIVLDGTFVLGYLLFLLAQAPFFGLLVLALGLLQIVLLLGPTRRLHGLTQRDLSAQAESHSYLVEALTGIAMLKASGTEDRALDHWSNLFFNQMNIALQRNHLVAVVEAIMASLRTLAPLILLWVGALRVLEGSMSLGAMLALNALAMEFLLPLASLVSAGQRLHLVSAHLDRLADVIEAEPEQDQETAQPVPRLAGQIELDHVSFRYSPGAPWVLRNISVTITPGQKIALVGRTGSGKSSLALLLLGLYEPTEGQIRFDGPPLPHLHYRSLRGQFGVVLQEPFLFSGSIRQNIAFNDPSLSLEQVMEAAQLAAIHDEIVQLPMGYETRLAEGGAGLSGGQRQRLAIARALAHRPAILLLDEATSHLDVLTEELVDQNLRRLACMQIVIAHRLSTVRNADLILVLDQGAIVEYGAHEELLAQGGHYAALIHNQLETTAAVAIVPTTDDRIDLDNEGARRDCLGTQSLFSSGRELARSTRGSDGAPSRGQ